MKENLYKLKILKFGGASLSEVKAFHRVRDLILEQLKHSKKLVVTVSAMGGVTNELIDLAHQVSDKPDKREMDMLVSVGERVSMSLLSMALKDYGIKAISLTGSQSGIITCGNHSQARILKVVPSRVLDSLKVYDVVILAGFQGVSESKEITTLGRGGSDTTAVAYAAALKAEEVIFYKDVDGVYSANPKKDTSAKRYEYMTHGEAIQVLETNQGEFIVHDRALYLARKNGVRLVLKTFLDPKISGTIIESPGGVKLPLSVPMEEMCDERITETIS